MASKYLKSSFICNFQSEVSRLSFLNSEAAERLCSGKRMGNKVSNPDDVPCSVTKESDTVVKMKDSVVKSSATVDEEMKDSEVQATVLPKKKLKVLSNRLMSDQNSAKANEAVAEAKKAFLMGNNFFRESNFDMAKIHYSWALKILQNKLNNVDHHKATALSNIGLIEFAEGRYSEAKALLSEAQELRKKVIKSFSDMQSARDEQWKKEDGKGKSKGMAMWKGKEQLTDVGVEKGLHKKEEEKAGTNEGEKDGDEEDGGDGIDGSIHGLESLAIELSRDHQMMFSRQPAPVTAGQRRLATTIKKHETVDRVTADSLNNLAACLEMMGRLDEAKSYYEESLKLRMTIYGERSLKVAESMQNLATILDSQGLLKDAERLLRRALSIYIFILGSDSPEAAVTTNNLAVVLCHLGEGKEGEKLLEQTVCSRASIYGEDHYFTKCGRLNLEYIRNKNKSVEDNIKDNEEKERIGKKKGQKKGYFNLIKMSKDDDKDEKVIEKERKLSFRWLSHSKKESEWKKVKNGNNRKNDMGDKNKKNGSEGKQDVKNNNTKCEYAEGEDKSVPSQNVCC